MVHESHLQVFFSFSIPYVNFLLVFNLLIVAAGEQGIGARQESFWTENVLLSLENINSEIREIWTILGKQQVPGN